MVASQLTLYQNALSIIGARPVASVTENRESARLLNQVWDDGAVGYCLEEGYWTFAINTIKIDSDPDFTANFGYQYAFTKPDDYDHTCGVWMDPYLQTPLLDYVDEDTVIYADITPIYVSYVSLLPQYGMNYGAWPAKFVNLVEAYLAWKIAPRLTLSAEVKKEVEKNYEKALLAARNFDLMNKPNRQLPMGTWNKARRGSYTDVQGGRGGY